MKQVAATGVAADERVVRRSALRLTLSGDAQLAGVLADLGMRAYYGGFALWIDARHGDELAAIVDEELDALLTVLPDIERQG